MAVAGCAGTPRPPDAALAEGPPVALVGVVLRGWHAEIVLPAEVATAGPLADLAGVWPAAHLAFGFGQRDYLLSADQSLGDMLRALLPGAGAMMLAGHSLPPEAVFGPERSVLVPVTAAGLERLTGFIAAGFARDAAGRPVPIGDRRARTGSVIYASVLRYSAGYTCNTWAAEALARAGLPVRAEGVVLAGQVLDRARRAADALPPPRRGVVGKVPSIAARRPACPSRAT